MMNEEMRVQPATGEPCPTIAGDLLRGADAIATFVFGRARTSPRFAPGRWAKHFMPA